MDTKEPETERMWLYKMQKKRVQMDHELEERLKKTFPSLNQDVRLLKELLDDLETEQGKKRGRDTSRRFA